MRRTGAALAVALCAGAVMGCGPAADPSGSESASVAPATPRAATTGPASPGPATDAASPPPPSVTGAPAPATKGPRPGSTSGMELAGTVEAGVEAGCLLLQGYVLVGDTAGLHPGDVVRVTGRPDPTLLTVCQQGTPFVVTAVER